MAHFGGPFTFLGFYFVCLCVLFLRRDCCGDGAASDDSAALITIERALDLPYMRKVARDCIHVGFGGAAHAISNGRTMFTMHPGEYLQMSYIDPYNIKQCDLAESLDVSTSTVSRLVAGKADLSADMAVRLSLVLDRSAESWMQMQTDHSLQKAKAIIDAGKLKPMVFDRVRAIA